MLPQRQENTDNGDDINIDPSSCFSDSLNSMKFSFRLRKLECEVALSFLVLKARSHSTLFFIVTVIILNATNGLHRTGNKKQQLWRLRYIQSP